MMLVLGEMIYPGAGALISGFKGLVVMIKLPFLKKLAKIAGELKGHKAAKANASSNPRSSFSQGAFKFSGLNAFGDMNNFNKQAQNLRIKQLQVGGGSLAFFPGATLILLGMAVLFAPKLVLAILATFFITVGCVALFVVWKLLKLKKQVTDAFGKASRGFVVQQVSSLSDFRFPRGASGLEEEADSLNEVEDAEFVEEIGPKGKKTTIVIH